MGLNIFNAGLQGSRTDQELLIQEQFADSEGYAWRLMRALYLRNGSECRWATDCHHSDPAPSPCHTRCRPIYLGRWRQVARDNTQVIDILPGVRRLARRGRRHLNLPDGHISSTGHVRVAELCNSSSVIRDYIVAGGSGAISEARATTPSITVRQA